MLMKNNFNLLLIILTVALYSHAQSYPSAEFILDRVDSNMSAKSRIVTSRMEISAGRGTRTIEMKSWSVGNEKSLTEYLAPAREKGTKMLKLENQLWLYSPSADRIVQISGHMLRQSVMGSDLSYEDMMDDVPLKEQYQAEVTDIETYDGRSCWVLTLTAKKPDVNYQTQKIWVDRERFVPLKVEMYSKSGKLLKHLLLSDVQRIQGRWFPMKMLYKDLLKTGDGTIMQFMDVQLDVPIQESIFSKSALK